MRLEWVKLKTALAVSLFSSAMDGGKQAKRRASMTTTQVPHGQMVVISMIAATSGVAFVLCL
jgi:hypothetical protein